MHRITLVAFSLVLAIALGACSDATAPEAPNLTAQEELLNRSPVADAARPGGSKIVEIALAVNAEDGEFSTLIAALGAAGLVDALNGSGQYTVFAPTDAAFAELGLYPYNVGDLDPMILTDILLYHVTDGRRISRSLLNARQVTMLNGETAQLSRMEGALYIDEARVETPDISASNGMIHIIDGVLLP
jgi:transforming growth factor-beta-induced protein